MRIGKPDLIRQSKRGPVIYWDTCVFLAWIKNEKRTSGEMEGLEDALKLVMQEKATLVTSVLTMAEILKSKTPAAGMAKLEKLFRRSNVLPLVFDMPVAKLTSQIRDHYNDSDFELSTPDAIHLATAIHYGATEFHTFDGSKKPKKSEKKRSGLLLLVDGVATHDLKIVKPSAEQPSLLANLMHLDVEASQPPEKN